MCVMTVTAGCLAIELLAFSNRDPSEQSTSPVVTS